MVAKTQTLIPYLIQSLPSPDLNRLSDVFKSARDTAFFLYSIISFLITVGFYVYSTNKITFYLISPMLFPSNLVICFVSTTYFIGFYRCKIFIGFQKEKTV